ncbi:exocyst complex component EXO70B1 [Magnolia sinica]|uniref:exocyst complex component EXO70B1 n=1 Tax=Magnolia sinica TaxID=86752 RepID=UPI002659DA24|nr:exocyst complex component EXO70B1 [Magnolia sinica]
MAATIDGDERVMATAQHILKSLGTTKDLTKDMISILSNFDHRFSAMTDLLPSSAAADAAGATETPQSLLDSTEQIILRGTSNSHDSLLWEDSPEAAADYLCAIDQILDLTLSSPAQDETLDRAESLLQVAMSRLEDEFRHILIRNTVPLDAGRLYGSIRRVSLSFTSNDGEITEDFESSVEEEERGSPALAAVSVGEDEDLPVDLVHPDAVADLREIADRMMRSGYEKECCQVYISVRRDVLDECLSILGVDKLSIEEVQKIEWKDLDEKMKKWAQAVKIAVRVLLSGEKRLCEQIFGPSVLIGDVCFAETAKGCVMQLLNFGEAVAISRRSAEKLFRILDMYDAIADVLPDLRALFPDDTGDFVCNEAEGILKGLGEAAKGTFTEFENAVQRETSRKPMQGGEIHPLTRYVMNYVRLLVDYSDSLNSLLDDNTTDNRPDGDDDGCLDGISPMGLRLLSLISCLESNLEEKSKLYEDGAMQYIFLMNNILYVVQKVKDSELGKLLGDRWVRKRRGQVRQYATSYLRASWSRVLSCLKDEGLGSGGRSSEVSKVALKERFKNFNLGFEEVYRNQTTWKVPDPQLREELRLSISDKVIPAYRSFMGRFGGHLESGRHAGKYIKYTPEDIENFLQDLFEGSPGPLNHLRRKLST